MKRSAAPLAIAFALASFAAARADDPPLALLQPSFEVRDVLVMESFPVQFAVGLEREMPSAGWTLRAEVVDQGARWITTRVTMTPPSRPAAQSPTPAQVNVGLGSLDTGRYVLVVESAIEGEDPEIVQAIVLEARGRAGQPADGLRVAGETFRDPRTEGERLVLTRDMPSAGWRLEPGVPERQGHRIQVPVEAVRPAGMAAQVITPTEVEIDLGQIPAGRYALVVEVGPADPMGKKLEARVVQIE